MYRVYTTDDSANLKQRLIVVVFFELLIHIKSVPLGCMIRNLIDCQHMPKKSQPISKNSIRNNLFDLIRAFSIITPISILIVNNQLRIIYANKNTFSLTGRDYTELIGMEILNLFFSGSRQTLKKRFSLKNLKEPVKYGTVKLGRGDGTIIIVGIDVIAISDIEGALTAYVVALVDKTKDTQDEEKKKENESIIRALVDASQDAAFLLEWDGTVLAMNKEAVRRLQLRNPGLKKRSRDFFIGKQIIRYYPEQFAENLLKYTTIVNQSGKPTRFKLPLGERDLDITIYPIKDKQTGHSRFAIYARDITEDIKSENKIRESENKYWHLIDQLYEGYIITDRNGKVIYTNTTVSRISGFEKTELIGHTFSDFYTGENKKKIMAHFELARNFESTRFEVNVTVKTGETLTMMVSATPIKDVKGEFDGVQAVIADVTVIKKIREQLRYRVEFEKRIIEISKSFINLNVSEIDTGIMKALDTIGRFNNEDSINLYQLDEDGRIAKKTHQWFADRIDHPFDFYETYDLDAYKTFKSRIANLSVTDVPDIEELEPEEMKEAEDLYKVGVRSFLIVPMILRKKAIGWIMICSFRRKCWSEDVITLLSTTLGVFAIALERKLVKSELIDVIMKRLSDREQELVIHLASGLQWPRDKRLIGKKMNVLPGTLDKFMMRVKEKIRSDDLNSIIDNIRSKGIASPHIE